MIGRALSYFLPFAFCLALAACRSADPPPEAVKRSAEVLFERAAKGERVPAAIPFTGQGTAAPKLTRSEIVARRKLARGNDEAFEYDVRLTYLNRIEQMEQGMVTIRFEKREGVWLPTYVNRTRR